MWFETVKEDRGHKLARIEQMGMKITAVQDMNELFQM